MPSISTVMASAVASIAIAGGGAIAYAVVGTEPPGPDRARVIKVIDGDTLDVRYDGSEHRIRLLNVDTPETKDPNKAVECLGPEATAYLEQQLKPDDLVRLEFDEELHDRYDRELAGVFEGDVLVNAEIARRGLGIPVLYEPNRLFYDEVVAAYDEGKKAAAGVFDPAVECTFASRVEEYRDSVAGAEAEASLTTLQEAADEVAAEGEALIDLIDRAKPGTLAAAGMSERELGALRNRVVGLQDRATTAAEDAAKKIRAEAKARAKEKAEAKAKKAAAKRKAEARRQAEEAEKQRAEAEAEAQRRAEQAAAEEARRQEQAEQAAAEEARRQEQQAPQPSYVPPSAPEPAPAPEPPAAPAQPGAGYTGCRAYVGGPYVDDQGRSYTPIDCNTKQPLIP